MKVSIEKQSQHHFIRVEVTTDPAKRPIVAELTAEQAAMLAQLLTQAARAERFKFQLEL